jgi:hypothetical protein
MTIGQLVAGSCLLGRPRIVVRPEIDEDDARVRRTREPDAHDSSIPTALAAATNGANRRAGSGAKFERVGATAAFSLGASAHPTGTAGD